MKTKTTEMFQTERLLVRHITEADIDAMHAVYGDADAMRWVDDGETLDRAGCAGWVEITKRNYEKYGYGMSVVVEKCSGLTVGFCGIVHPGGQSDAEIKYAFLRAHWGQGIASETVQGMVAYGAEQFGLRRIIATIDPENGASERVLTKAGMSVVGTEQDEDGAWTRTLVWCA